MTTIATMIRDQAMIRLKKLTPDGGSWKSFRKIALPTIEPNQLPCLGVYILRESLNPDGDANVGPPRYIADVTIGISIIDEGNKSYALEGSIDSLVDQAEDTLLQDITFLGMTDANNNPIIEAIPQITRTYNFFEKSETYMMECRLQMTIQYRCFFEPLAPNYLETIAINVSNMDGTVLPADEPYVLTIDTE